jgi:oxygen-dependent protoporphyrinogen oxidase
MQPGKFDTIIIGAGIGGLSLAYRLAERGRRVMIAEKQDHPGGVVRTETRDGFLLEKGPNSFSSGEEMMTLMHDAGIEARALSQPIRDHDRFVWKGGRLRKVPMGPMELATTDVLSVGEKLRLVSGFFRAFAPLEKDVELGTFFRQRLGDGLVDSLLKPFMAGVYASDADRISFQATLPRLYDSSRREGRLLSALKDMKKSAPKREGPRKPRCLVSFPEGLQELPSHLAKKLGEMGVEIRLDRTISLERGTSARWNVVTGENERSEADDVVLTSAASDTATMLAPHAPQLAGFLRQIEYAPLTIAHVGARAEQFSGLRPGFGFLTADNKGVELLGIIWSSQIFPGRAPDGHVLLTCFYGGEKRAAANKLSDEELVKTVRQDLKTTMGFDGGELRLCEITRWKEALPIFRVGHLGRLEEASEELPDGLHLLANYAGNISMPERVKQAEKLAQQLVASRREAAAV